MTRIAAFSFFTILKFHEKYLNSCESKEYVRRKLKYIPIYLNKAKAFLETFSESG